MPRGRPAGKKSRKTVSKKASKSKDPRDFGISKQFSEPPQPLIVSNQEPTQLANRVEFNENAIQNYQELIAALSAKKVQITLANDIIIEDNILINYDVAINFNGYSIISEESRAAARVLDIRSGEVTLTGRGKIFAMGARSVAIRVFGAISTGVPNYTALTIDEGISLFAPDAYGIIVSPNLGVAYGVTINFSGQIMAHDGICLANGIRGRDQNLPVINIKSEAKITVDELNGKALEASGYCQWNIAAAKLYGAIGASMTAGVLEFNHTQIIANQASFHLEETSDTDLEVTINGGAYVGKGAYNIIGSASAVKEFVVKGGDFCSRETAVQPELDEVITVEEISETHAVEEFIESLNTKIELLPEPEPEVGKTTTKTLQTMPTQKALEAEKSAALNLPLPVLEQSAIEQKPKKQTRKKSMILITPEQPFAVKVDQIPELMDDATDEKEILLELVADKVEPPKPVEMDLPKPAKPAVSELDAARRALSDAITEIRKLSAMDYDAGFSDLEYAIRGAERVLKDPLSELTHIRDTAAELLQAFDGLEEQSEFSMSDAELDELFYHGAVLGEMVASAPVLKSKKHLSNPVLEASSSLTTQAVEVESDIVSTPVIQSEIEPDFSVLNEIFNTIAGLNLDKYSIASREELLDELERAKSILLDVSATQNAVDELTSSLLAQLSHLELQTVQRSTDYAQTKLSGPVPLAGRKLSPFIIDEQEPATIWSSGATMIDELTPFVTDAETHERMLLSAKSYWAEFSGQISKPFKRISRSFSVGVKAGLRAYRETLQSWQNQ